jgi:ADP-heptose:LPS heptosyltransferase
MRGLIRLIIILLAILRSLFFWNIKKRNPKKILIAHDLLLGDTLLLAPLMKRIHEKYPKAQKFILSKPLFEVLFRKSPYGFTALSYNPKSIISLWNILFYGPYDLTFIAGDNRYSWLARAIGSRWIVGIAHDKPQWKNWMLDEAKSFDLKPATWADMMGRLVDNKDPKPYKKHEWLRPNINQVLSFKNSKSYIVCHLGASNPLKFWPAKSWQRLIQELKDKGFDIFISVGPGEEHLIREIDPYSKCHQAPGTYSLLEMWSLIEHAKFLISVDTGIAHLAKLSNTPIVTLFGPGSHVSHGSGNFWKFSHHADITKSDFHCRNQPVLFRRKIDWLKRCGRNISQCKTPGACMDAITPEQVMKFIRKNFFS